MMRRCGSAQAFVIPRNPWAHGSPWGPMGEDKSAPRVACKQVLGIGGAWCMHRVSVDEHWLIELVADLPTLLSNAERLLSTKLSHVAQAQGATRGSLGAPWV